MDVPDLVRDSLGGEEIEAGVNLGDEDTVCLTPTRTLVYRAEGLLSDEKVEEFPHDVERLDVSEGRRKTKFVLQYVDETREFSVPPNRDTQVLELLFQGILREAGVIDAGESVAGAFRFSELALIVTDARVVKHIGSTVWTDDYEVYPFAELTGLSFDRGSVATEVVIEIGGRPQRVKTPNEQARKVQHVIENAAFEFHGVTSLEELNATVADDGSGDPEQAETGGGLELGDGIDPLVTDHEDETSGVEEPMESSGASESSEGVTSRSEPVGDDGTGKRVPASEDSTAEAADRTANRTADTDRSTRDATDTNLDGVEAQLAELTAVVQRQNELLEKQQRTIKQLIEELREGR